MSPATRTLCLGPVDFLNGAADQPADRPFVLVDLPPCLSTAAPNTYVLDLQDTTPLPVTVLAPAGHRAARHTMSAADLFEQVRPSDKLRALLGEGAGLGSVIPLFVLRDGGAERHLYSQIRFAPDDALLVRTTDQPLVPTPADSLDWFGEACRLHAEQALFLNNHQRYYRKCLSDSEVEVKFTLEPASDIWDLNADAYQRIARGDLGGYVPEYRDEFQQWDFPTRLYEITDPDQVGYISFIPTPDGRHLVKQKRFSADALVRKESISAAQRLSGTTEDFIRGKVGESYRKLPALRRVRYDVNFESLASGHVYGIFFDRVSVIGAPHVAMSQCEVEYLRSRTAVPPDTERMFAELDEILAWTRSLLDDRSASYTEGYYSKLSFLRDAVEAGRVVGDPSAGILE